MNFAYFSSPRLAFGPGSAVTSRGVFASKVVGMSSSIEEIKRLELVENFGAKQARERTNPGVAGEREKKNLGSLRRAVLAAGRPGRGSRGGTKGKVEGCDELGLLQD